MNIRRVLFPAVILAISLSIALPLPVEAGLPALMDNQTLPSLAPMLERATPAVVNIATESGIASPARPSG